MNRIEYNTIQIHVYEFSIYKHIKKMFYNKK